MEGRPDGIGIGIEAIAEHTGALVDLVRGAPLDTPIPSCHGWTLADLTWHLAEVQDFWRWIVHHRPAGPDGYPGIDRPDDGALPDLLRRSCGALVAALRGTDPVDEAWSWSGDHTVAFTLRRQSHEALVHRVDGVLAVDELVTVMLTGVPPWASYAPTRGSIRLVATDTNDTWRLAFGRMTGTSPDTGTSYDLDALELLDPADGSTHDATTLSGCALALDLWLWGRLAGDAVHVEGDPAGAALLRTIAANSTR